MSLRNISMVVLAGVVAATQLACYNTYTIDRDELSKLEATPDRQETVEVQADCPDDDIAEGGESLDGRRFAEAESGQPDEEARTDASAQSGDDAGNNGCTTVPVSTVNALTVLTSGGGQQRVTPFNFVMDEVQLVSPEYDVLVPLEDVQGAEVREFSPWKTAGTIAGVSVATIGTFVGVSLLAPQEEGF